jgi:protoheme IX farnesyltransferase
MPLAQSLHFSHSIRETAEAYYELCKPRVVALMVFTAWVGMLLVDPSVFPLQSFVSGSIGIALMAASAAAINHVVDRHVDARMYRTKARPIPSGSLSASQSLAFAAVLGIVGLFVLLVGTNMLTAILTTLSLMGYAFVYTLYLKRATPQNIVIGGAAGATPPLLGWIAVTGQVDPYALVLFLIIFTWTPPHFWALAIYRKEEYAKVNIPMLPVTHGEDFTRLQIVFYTLLLLAVTMLPFLMGVNGLVYLIGAVLLGGTFLCYALMMWYTKSPQWAIKTFVFSIVYLFLLFFFLLFDRYLPFLSEQLVTIG